MPAFSTCSGLARDIGAPLAGTAPQSRGWLLVAYSGPWTHKPWQDNAIDPEAGATIARRGTRERIKPWFIRRHGTQYEPDARVFHWAVVDGLTREIQWRPAATLGQIAAAEWLPEAPAGESAATASSPIFGASSSTEACRVNNDDLLYLVCTHGRRDQCCATLGRPVAAEAHRLRPQQTWECSHVGGHRLAGNLVVLPHGLYYGFVDQKDVAAVVAATENGLVYPRLLRGSSLDSPPVQAAKSAIYQASHDHRIDSLRATAIKQLPDERWMVHIEHSAGGQSLVRVDRLAGPEAPESCNGDPVPSISWLAEML